MHRNTLKTKIHVRIVENSSTHRHRLNIALVWFSQLLDAAKKSATNNSQHVKNMRWMEKIEKFKSIDSIEAIIQLNSIWFPESKRARSPSDSKLSRTMLLANGWLASEHVLRWLRLADVERKKKVGCRHVRIMNCKSTSTPKSYK